MGLNSIYVNHKRLFIIRTCSPKCIIGKTVKNIDGRLEFALDVKTIMHWCYFAQI